MYMEGTILEFSFNPRMSFLAQELDKIIDQVKIFMYQYL